MSSFLKYQQELAQQGLHWNRAHLDGMPFRGTAPMLREEEYADLTEQVKDFDVGLFHLDLEEDCVKLRGVLDRVCNGWYQIVDYDKQWVDRADGKKTVCVYLMWFVPYKQLATARATTALGAHILGS